MVLTQIHRIMAISPLLMVIMTMHLLMMTMLIIWLIITVVMRSLKRKGITGSDDVAVSISKASTRSSKRAKAMEEAKKERIVMQNYNAFKKFDVVDDFSDHHYGKTAGFEGCQPTQAWTKNINKEWKIMESSLPDTINVRVSERRMDLLRAVITGPAGTPYHDGLFVFDVHFPPKYPKIPPEVHYYSGGLRINPNLYKCGKVCLSLLNTWGGQGNERWLPKTSTMLQVLVSIQALVLNEKPFFNEPGYARDYRGSEGVKRSKKYNEDAFILSLRTMMYTLKTPPQHFEDFVSGHFLTRGRAILVACRAYMEGADVGSTVEGELQVFGKLEKRKRKGFEGDIAEIMNRLVESFTKNGSKDCDKFLFTD